MSGKKCPRKFGSISHSFSSNTSDSRIFKEGVFEGPECAVSMFLTLDWTRQPPSTASISSSNDCIPIVDPFCGGQWSS